MSESTTSSSGAPAIRNETSEVIPIDDLIPHPGNPRKGDVDAIAESIRENGFYGSLTVHRASREIVAGNHRWKAAKQVGMTFIPVTWIDVDYETARRILLADNRTSDLATYDWDTLAKQLKEAPTLKGTGFNQQYLDELLAKLNHQNKPKRRSSPDDAPPLPETAITEYGGLYGLGEHRLIVGDSTKSRELSELMNGETADMVFTDPPYGVGYVGGTDEAMTIQNDEKDDQKLSILLRAAFRAAGENVKPGGSWYVAAPAGPQFLVFAHILSEMGIWRQTIVWEKNSLVLGHSDYHYRHECIFYGWNTETPAEAFVSYKEGYLQEAHESIFYGWMPNGAHMAVPTRNQDTIWKFDRPSASRVHPTMKPTKLINKAIENSSKPGQIVLDPFAGSGSTLISADSTGRKARLVEISPRYADVICKRWQDYTGERPIDLRTGRAVDFSA